MSKEFDQKQSAKSPLLLPPSDGDTLLNFGAASKASLFVPLDHAGAEAKGLISRAAHLAAEKAPEIRKKAENLANMARTTISDSQARKTFMESNRKKIVISAAAVAVLLGIGWTFVKHQATSAARDRIEAFLIRSKLYSNVAYRGVSASPFGSVTLSDVTIRDFDGAVVAKIGSLEFSNMETKEDLLMGIKVTADSFEMPLLPLARGKWHTPMIVSAIGMGYATLKGTLSLSGRFDDQRQTLSIETDDDIQDVGLLDAKIQLDNINSLMLRDAATEEEKVRSQQDSAPASFLMSIFINMQSLVVSATLEKANVTVNNTGYFKRSHEITDSDMPSHTTPSARTGNMQAPTPLEIAFVRGGLSTSEAKASVAALENWDANGGVLNVTTNITQPIPLVQFASEDFPSIMVETKALVSN